MFGSCFVSDFVFLLGGSDAVWQSGLELLLAAVGAVDVGSAVLPGVLENLDVLVAFVLGPGFWSLFAWSFFTGFGATFRCGLGCL